MARHFTERITLQQQTFFFIVRKVFLDSESFYDAKKHRGVATLDVREQTVQLKWSKADGRFTTTAAESLETAMADHNLENSHVVPAGLFELHGTSFGSFADYTSFFESFPTVNEFKAAFTTIITLPPMPLVSDYTRKMSRENENSHLLTQIAQLQARLAVTEEPVQ